MYTARVEEWFAAAHFLVNFHGKCENLHGHNYKVRVTVKGTELDEGGMLCDFGILKSALKDVFKELDHCNLNDVPFFSDGNPSAERIAEYIFIEMEKRLDIEPAALSLVEVFETEKHVASYSRQ
ncbi:6-carboxytetrahydropterin synthase QueD [Spirochaeta isovalerica]|uniref:6-carboxy-5,6,7,8-tetrahydropterin synthase n=1 Tax=Spirochaeta isovalerica TaxID=150 RepID=A0A841RF90_9SPIO|nr:6-carboxytetrahydropterin synthase QueD [Spirochaeta isovalerica]MBB6481660.1 6-pyruvoyltetrahydropterin/6-carboxytetrahydropterin synthase [Spirochaeta isovalerica]